MVEHDPADAKSAHDDTSETVVNPAELIRLSAMTARLLEEVREASLDDAGCRSLVRIHGRAMEMIESTLSTGLRSELVALAPRIESRATEAELRIAQAQLVGWLDGLVLSLQAAAATPPAPPAVVGPVPGGHAYL